MRPLRIILSSLFSLLVGSACSDVGSETEDDTCPAGELDCPCLEGATCSSSLTCSSGTCIDSAVSSGGSSSGAGGSASGGSLGSGGIGSGGASSGGSTQGSGGTGEQGFTLTSSELTAGGTFLDKHTCQQDGFDNDQSPPLAWSGAPEGTQSFAITFIDRTFVDESNPLGYHWAIWDIAGSVSELPANLPSGMNLTTPISATQSRASYLGPCPYYGQSQPGETPHAYEFTIYALATSSAGVSGMIDEMMVSELSSAALATATLSGISFAASTQ